MTTDALTEQAETVVSSVITVRSCATAAIITWKQV
jgi:hypothetical protein